MLSTTPVSAPGAEAQPGQMSGLPLQVSDLPPGTVSVRVIRRTFADNVAGQEVKLAVGEEGRVLTAVTDADGRALFRGLAVGEMMRARTAVDGEPLASQFFELPARGGVRIVLVAGAGTGDPAPGSTPEVATAPASAAQPSGERSPMVDVAIIGTFFVFTVGAVGLSVARNRRHISREAGRG